MSTQTSDARGGLRSALNHLGTFWGLLSLPAVALLVASLQGAEAGQLLHSSGELSVRLLILALAITPLRLLFPKHRWPKWLLARRRAIGVASFLYGALHLGFYAWFEGLLTNLTAPEIATGWVALMIMLPLALTSTNGAVKRLGRRWKTLQRGAYLAAALGAAHWWLLDEGLGPVLVHFLPLAALEIYRLTRRGRAG